MPDLICSFCLEKPIFCYVYPHPIRSTEYKGTPSMAACRGFARHRAWDPAALSCPDESGQYSFINQQHFWVPQVSPTYTGINTNLLIYYQKSIWFVSVILLLSNSKMMTYHQHTGSLYRWPFSKLQFDCRHGSAASWFPPKTCSSIKMVSSLSFIGIILPFRKLT